MAEADAFSMLHLIGPDMCGMIHYVSNEPREETRVGWRQDASWKLS